MAATLTAPLPCGEVQCAVSSPPQQEDRRHGRAKKLLNAVASRKTEGRVAAVTVAEVLSVFERRLARRWRKKASYLVTDALAESSVPC